ncbi:MAG TPA: redoxin family protein, partial [Isosphaeraceae bacterium]|nr:redoxin family protein [Isosphaeraceae bacterium]
EVAGAYKALPSYADSGKLIMSMERKAPPGDDAGRKGQLIEGEAKRTLSFARPNKLALEYLTERCVSDGKTMRVFLDRTRKYAEAPAPPVVDERAIIEAPLAGNVGRVFFGGPGDLAVAVILDLLSAEDAVKSVLDGTDGLKLEVDRTLGDKPCKSLFVDQSEGPDIRMLVDQDTKLVQAIELVYNVDEVNARAPEGAKINKLAITWKAGTIRKEAPAEVYSTEPPPGFEKLAPANDDKKAKVEVGKPAPDFTLTVLDTEGKTRKVTKADLAGKVVMLDLWATWCAPCLKELPEVQKMVDAYTRDKKNVVVVAVSQDSDPSEIPELRKLIEKTLKEHKARLIEGPVSMVAVDPEQAIATLYDVEGIPTTFLLDTKGVVRAIHSGYTEGEILTQEIDALLAGKPIPKPAETGTDKPESNK